MVKLSVVEAQLKAVGCSFRFWGRSELKELCEVLLPGETIAQAVNGQYEGGWAMLVATDFRVLLIDKKPKYLTLKDIRFDMITELDFSGRMMNSCVRIYTPNRELRFTTPSAKRLRKLFTHTQHKVMEIRHHFMMQQFQQQQVEKNTPPGLAIAMQRQEQMAYEEDNQRLSVPAQAHFYQQSPPAEARHHDSHSYDSHHDPSDEQRKLAAAMGAAGLRSIVHNGRVIKDYMAVPFTQRWRKRPYGYTHAAPMPRQ